jgi:hypothetical protein
MGGNQRNHREPREGRQEPKGPGSPGTHQRHCRNPRRTLRGQARGPEGSRKHSQGFSLGARTHGDSPVRAEDGTPRERFYRQMPNVRKTTCGNDRGHYFDIDRVLAVQGLDGGNQNSPEAHSYQTPGSFQYLLGSRLIKGGWLSRTRQADVLGQPNALPRCRGSKMILLTPVAGRSSISWSKSRVPVLDRRTTCTALAATGLLVFRPALSQLTLDLGIAPRAGCQSR